MGGRSQEGSRRDSGQDMERDERREGRVEERRHSTSGFGGGEPRHGAGHVTDRRQSEGYGREKPLITSGDGQSRGYGERHSSGGYGYGRESTTGGHGDHRRPGGSETGSSASHKEAPAQSYKEYKARKEAEKAAKAAAERR